MTALPPPSWPVSDEDGKLTPPWYNYLKAADDTWRVKVVSLTSLSTVSDPTADLVSNSGVTVFNSTPAVTRTLADPVLGCRKTLCVVSTSTTGKVTMQTTTKSFRPGPILAWFLTFPTSDPYKVVELMGISTSEYLIVSNPGGAVATTV
jgi:hypothetical protein